MGTSKSSDDHEPEGFALTRRALLRVAATAALGLGGCVGRTTDRLIPWLAPNDQILAGVDTWYATSCRECPAGCGMIVRNREQRVVKCEGNPLHPINAGRLCARGQAAPQGLYDPDRLAGPLQRGSGGAHQPQTWEAALAGVAQSLASARPGQVAVISDLQSGSLAGLIRQWLTGFGSDRYLIHESVSYEGLAAARGIMFGRRGVPVYPLQEADFILSLAADFLDTWVSPVQYTRQFAEARVRRTGEMPRLTYVGPRMSLTAANADERLLLSPGAECALALAMVHCLVRDGRAALPRQVAAAIAGHTPEAVAAALELPVEGIRGLARDFAAARAPVALGGYAVGDLEASTRTAAAAELLNWAVGTPLTAKARHHALGEVAASAQLHDFVQAMSRGLIRVLVVLGGNPVYSMPPGTGFTEALKAVPHVVALGPFMDETAAASEWVLPTCTPLEDWGDYEPQEGVTNLLQPVMGRVRDARPAGDVLLGLAAAAGRDVARLFGAHTWEEFLRGTWRVRAQQSGADPDIFWEQALGRGGCWTEPPAAPLPTTVGHVPDFGRPASGKAAALWVYPSVGLYDGRGANKRWLQELPDPMTGVTWASWAEMNSLDARGWEVAPGELLEASVAGRSVRLPVVLSGALAQGVIAVPLGQGHGALGRYARGRGINGHLLADLSGRTVQDLKIRPLGPAPFAALPASQGSASEDGRRVVLTVALSEAGRGPREPISLPLPEGMAATYDLYPPHRYPDHRWAMVVDLSRCVGCGACVTACYAENNIGVVGGDYVARNRAMAWIRIDRYWEPQDPRTPVLFQPMMCQHCDAAPCESVCPVFAASHNDEGLNVQVYNRCVGTRYCNNNCPYKVRRFNWLDYEWPEPLNLQANPEVTVRRRGVMEKCSFCIQRIRRVEYQAKRENRPVRDGEVVPACAQTCPAGAISFGDLMNQQSQVSRLIRDDPRAYQVLQHLNTKPGVVYLKRLVNDGFELTLRANRT